MGVLAAEFQLTPSWVADLLVAVAVYATLAASLNLVTGFAGMFSLGHHGFFAVGAYAAAAVATRWTGAAPGSASGLGAFATSFLVAGGAAALAGLLVGLPCLRLRGDYLAIATLAFGEIVRIVIENLPDAWGLGGSRAIFVPRLLFDPTGRVEAFRWVSVALGGAMLAATLLVLRNLVASAHGRAIVSVREDEVASELLGVRTTAYKIRAFVLGAAVAGVAGAFFAHYEGNIAPTQFDLMVGVRVLLVVVLGGLGNLGGTVAAAAVLLTVERLLLAEVFGTTAKEWTQVLFAAFLIVLMLGGRAAAVCAARRLLRGRAARAAP